MWRDDNFVNSNAKNLLCNSFKRENSTFAKCLTQIKCSVNVY